MNFTYHQEIAAYPSLFPLIRPAPPSWQGPTDRDHLVPLPASLLDGFTSLAFATQQEVLQSLRRRANSKDVALFANRRNLTPVNG